MLYMYGILFVRMHDPLFVKSALLGRHLALLCVTGGGFIFVRPFIYSQHKKLAIHTQQVPSDVGYKDVLFQQLAPALLLPKHQKLLCVTLICSKRSFINDKIAYLCDLSFKAALCTMPYISCHYIAIFTTKITV